MSSHVLWTGTLSFLVLCGLTFAQPRPYYSFTTIAKQGDLGLTTLSGVSLNDRGTIAFAGKKNGPDGLSRDNLYTFNPATGLLTPLLIEGLIPPNSGNAPTQTFSDRLQIRNDDVVVAQRRMDAVVLVPCLLMGLQFVAPLTYLEKWTANVTGLPQHVAMGDAQLQKALGCVLNPMGSPLAALYPNPPFQAIYPGGISANNSGQFAVAAIDPTGVNTRATGIHSGIPWLGGNTGTLVIQPRMSDTGAYVFSTGTRGGNIVLEKFDFSEIRYIAGPDTVAPGSGFSTVGLKPTISDDGKVVVFYGDLDVSAAAALGLAPGPGVFAYYLDGPKLSDGKLVRLDRRKACDSDDLRCYSAVDFRAPDNVCDPMSEISGYCQTLGRDGNGIAIDFDFTGHENDEFSVIHQPSGAETTFVAAFSSTPTRGLPPLNAFEGGHRGLWTIRVDTTGSGATRAFRIHVPLPVAQVNGIDITDLKMGDSLAIAAFDDNGSPRPATNRGEHRLAFIATTPSGPEVLRATQLDTDQDGLFDHWETSGVDFDGDGIVDLPLHTPGYGANVNHKDVFLEADYLSGATCCQPMYEGLAAVSSVFAAAPVANPDGITGIRLHITSGTGSMTDDPVPYVPVVGWDKVTGAGRSFRDIKNGSDGTGHPLPCGTGANHGYFGSWNDRVSANCANIIGAKRLVFRYALFVDEFSQSGTVSGSTGIAELPGNDLVVAVGGLPDAVYDSSKGDPKINCKANETGSQCGRRAMEAGTLMHELGHTLGLKHGGGDDENCKPNHVSVMNYTLQVPDMVPVRKLDYSRRKLVDLDENALDEVVGVGAIPVGPIAFYAATAAGYRVSPTGGVIDWNGSGSLQSSVTVDLNSIIPVCVSSGLTVLKGFDDWSNLLFDFRDTGNSGDGSSLQPSDPSWHSELTRQQIQAAAARGDYDGDGVNNAVDNCPVDFNPDQKDSKGNGIGDVCRPLAAQVTVPNVVGLTLASATTALTSAGLVAGAVTTASSSTVPVGSVITQNPSGGTLVSTGSPVSLVLSSGPAQVAVPNTVGLTQAAASTAIQAAGLVVGVVTTMSSSTVPAGSVISQNPSAGTLVNAGSSVGLVLSSGPAQVAVPNTVGLTQAAATTAIHAAGLVVGVVTTTASGTVPTGSVVSQNPSAGTLVNVGSAVDLIVAGYDVPTFQLRYFNTKYGSGQIIVSNAGAMTSGSNPADDSSGTICANFYSFDPNEEMQTCCSCPVTPNGLSSLNVNEDIAAQNLIVSPASALTVKVVFTVKTSQNGGGTCDPTKPTSFNLARGGLAWGTNLRSLSFQTNPPAAVKAVTTTKFAIAELSGAELSKLATYCQYIKILGSNVTGTCKSCQTGTHGGIER